MLSNTLRSLSRPSLTSTAKYNVIRCKHSSMNSTFYAADAKVISNTNPTKDKKAGSFGEIYTDHMLEINWNIKDGWQHPMIKPFENLSLHPGAKVLHYAVQLFEGVKAFRGVDGKIRIFRLDKNMERMKKTALRTALPDFDGNELSDLIKQLVKKEVDWVPSQDGSSLYIRPFLIGTDYHLGCRRSTEAKLFVILSPTNTGYYGDIDKSVCLFADPKFIRSFPGGVGAFKMGSNYAPSIMVGEEAEAYGAHQVLWLYDCDEKLTEVGTMNIFIHLKDSNGNQELVTPPLDTGLILPGITRDSLIALAQESGKVKVSEREITMEQIRKAVKQGKLLGIFGSGTAAVVSPVDAIKYRHPDGKLEHIAIPCDTTPSNIMYQLKKKLLDIQYGKIQRPEWITIVD